jgi:large subunit ribosomal protein L4
MVQKKRDRNMIAKLYDIEGKEKGTIELSESVFSVKPNKSAVYYALCAELANARQGTVSTKGRSEVSGSGAKPWRQKGTGRARAGCKRSPLWRGGGTVFGPKPRDYSIRLPKKVKRLSVKSLLAMKAQADEIKVVEDFIVESGKTRDFYRIASNLVDEEKRRRVIIIDKDRNELNKRAGRNLPWIKYYDVNLLNTKDLIYATQLVITESAVKVLNEKYA